MFLALSKIVDIVMTGTIHAAVVVVVVVVVAAAFVAVVAVVAANAFETLIM